MKKLLKKEFKYNLLKKEIILLVGTTFFYLLSVSSLGGSDIFQNGVKVTILSFSFFSLYIFVASVYYYLAELHKRMNSFIVMSSSLFLDSVIWIN